MKRGGIFVSETIVPSGMNTITRESPPSNTPMVEFPRPISFPAEIADHVSGSVNAVDPCLVELADTGRGLAHKCDVGVAGQWNR